MAKLTIILEAKNLVSGVAKKVRGDISGVATGVSGGLRKLNKSLGSIKLGIGSMTTALIGAGGLTFAFKQALGAAIDFEKGLAEIKTLGVEKSLDAIGSEVDELSRSFGQRPQAVIRAYYDAISAGVKEANVAQFLREASTLALAGATDISTATDLLTTLRSVYGDLTDKELAAFANATKNLGKTTIPELAANFGQIAPTAAAAGVSMDELSALMAVLSVSLSDTGLATTGLRSLLSQIIKPSQEAKDATAGLKSEFSLSALKAKGFEKFLSELLPEIEGNDEAIVALFGDVRAFNAAAILAKEGGEAFKNAMAKVREEVETGALEKAAAQMKDTAAVRLDTLRAELDSVVRALTLQLLPGISDFAKGISDIIALKTGRVFEHEFVGPIKKTGAEVRRLQEEIVKLDTPLKKFLFGSRQVGEELDALDSELARANERFHEAAFAVFPEFSKRLATLISQGMREGKSEVRAYADAVQRLGGQLAMEAKQTEAAAEAKEKEAKARLAAKQATEEETAAKVAAQKKVAEEAKKAGEALVQEAAKLEMDLLAITKGRLASELEALRRHIEAKAQIVGADSAALQRIVELRTGIITAGLQKETNIVVDELAKRQAAMSDAEFARFQTALDTEASLREQREAALEEFKLAEGEKKQAVLERLALILAAEQGNFEAFKALLEERRELEDEEREAKFEKDAEDKERRAELEKSFAERLTEIQGMIAEGFEKGELATKAAEAAFVGFSEALAASIATDVKAIQAFKQAFTSVLSAIILGLGKKALLKAIEATAEGIQERDPSKFVAAAKWAVLAGLAAGAAAAVKGLKEGGIVHGGTPGKDSIPALLAPGEAVLNAGLTRQLVSQLGTRPTSVTPLPRGFQEGGLVPATPAEVGIPAPQFNITMIFERSFANAREMARDVMDAVSNEARRFGYTVNVSTAEELQEEVPGGAV